MTRPALTRRAGDPLLAVDLGELRARLSAELAAHDHRGGPLGARLPGAAFDPQSAAQVRSVQAQRVVVGGVDAAAAVEGSVAARGGRVAGDLQVQGDARVAGDLQIGPGQPGSAVARVGKILSDHSQTGAPAGLQASGGAYLQAQLAEVQGCVVELQLRWPALVLVQLRGSYSGPVFHEPHGMLGRVPSGLPVLALCASRGERWVVLDGVGAPGQDPLDLEARLAAAPLGPPRWEATVWDDLAAGSAPRTFTAMTGGLPVSRAALVRVGPGALRLSAWAWFHGTLGGADLSATTLTELCDV